MGRFVHAQLACAPFAVNPCYKELSKILLVPHAVNTDHYCVDASKRETLPVFIYAGNLIIRKGLDLWFAACAQLMRECSLPFKIRLVGGGDRAWAEGLVVEHGLQEVVEFIGFKEGAELIQEYQAASAFVLPSRYDTYGVVTHEAAACGLPLIISKYAGSSEVLVEEGVNGFCVDPYNPAELCNAMKAILTDRNLREKMGLRSRELAVEWSVDKCGEKIANLIQELQQTE
jgi:glycosyltransferase involved in cell wall biosynthesis